MRCFFKFIILILITLPGTQLQARSTMPNMGDSPLHWAAENGVESTVTLLLEQGADVNAPGWFGNTPLHLAVRYPNIVKILLENGADVTLANNFKNTPLHVAVRYTESVDLLLQYGADPSVLNNFDKSPIEICMRRGPGAENVAVLEKMLRAAGN